MDLLIIGLISLLVLPAAVFTTGPLRIALGLACVLFFPGYTLIAALFPRKGTLHGIERLALSFGLSLAVVPLIGLGLNYTPWGIRFLPIILSLASFIIAAAVIAYYRRQQLPIEERYDPKLRPRLASYTLAWRGQSRWDKVLTIFLIVAILGALGSLIYVIAVPKVGEKFTQFYVLGAEGKAEGYPKDMTLGQEASLKLGIVNDEHEPVVYLVAVTIDGEKVKNIGPIQLEHGQKWEEEVGFRPTRVGEKQRLEFLLYKGEASELYRSLHFWVSVRGGQ